ncbi:MAG: radical SAM protein [Bacteroidales bacterium]|nr:radical SAM protein [Bacteroidales bacterium]
MPTFLFDEIVFGPVKSRRLGSSLGINLLPVKQKYCNFNCLYCECGLTDKNYVKYKADLPARTEIAARLNTFLADYLKRGKQIDTVTFAGNGEPTLHPEFPEIIDDTITISRKYYPEAKIAVLSNATLISNEKIFNALHKVDYNILKLDSALEETVRIMNCPLGNFSVEKLVRNLKKFTSGLTLQTLFVRGTYQGTPFDNTTDHEISEWLKLLDQIRPELVMVYTIARDTPIESIERISEKSLNEIAERVKQLGLAVSVSA